MMRPVRSSWLIPCCVAMLIGAEPAWKKPIPSWTEEDARQILSNSPWAKTVVAGVAPLRGEDQRREGGTMGQPHGIGYDGLSDGIRPGLPKNLFRKSDTLPNATAPAIRLLVRWESALPIRAAILKARETGSPILPENRYSIAVYGIPGTYFGDPTILGNPLKAFAALKRLGQKDVKPSSVEVLQLESGAAVIYLFPQAAKITEDDGNVEFTALIGRLQISQIFNLTEMQFHDKIQ